MNGTSSGSGEDTLRALERYQGTSSADVLLGSDRDEHLSGHVSYADPDSGTDEIYGRGGNDTITLNSAGRVHAGAGRDMVSVSGSAEVRLGPGRDDVTIGFGEPRVWGGRGYDQFKVLDAAQPFVHGGRGRDYLRLRYRTHDNVIDLREHTGTVRVWSVTYVQGSERDEVIRGSRAHETFYGGGDDRLIGRAGDDRLLGEEGSDTAWGGPGTDRCRAETRHSC